MEKQLRVVLLNADAGIKEIYIADLSDFTLMPPPDLVRPIRVQSQSDGIEKSVAKNLTIVYKSDIENPTSEI